MSLPFFIKGFVLGLSIAAPVGPIGVLCIRRSLIAGWKAGFATGLGAAVADAIYGAVAAFGLNAVSGFLVGQRQWLALAGGAFLCWIGIRTIVTTDRTAMKEPAPLSDSTGRLSYLGSFAATVVLTLTNPMTILSFVAAFAGLGLAGAESRSASTVMVAGVFLGSAMWWWILSSTASAFGKRFSASWLPGINRASGVIILAYGILALVMSPRSQ